MFHLPERLSTSAASRPDTHRYLKRALLFGAGLLLLWIALQLMPSSGPPEPSTVHTDNAGTVATRSEPVPDSRLPGFFTIGNVAALLLLGGGVAFAVYLRQRTQSADGPTPITPLGDHAIGPNQSLRLVECAGEVLLIGVTSGQVSLLRTYPADRFDLHRRDEAGPRGGASAHFADVLQRYAGSHGRTQSNGSTC